MKKLIILVGLSCTLHASARASPRSDCFSDKELSDVITVIGPALLNSINEQCAAGLPSGLIIGNPSSVLARNIAASSKEAWPRAIPSIIRVVKARGGSVLLTDKTMTLRTFTEGIAPALAINITLEKCDSVDKMLKFLEPLPPENLSGFFVQVVHLVKDKAGLDIICRPD